MSVRYAEGISKGFLVVTQLNGRKIADGDSDQVAHGDRVTSRLKLQFKDGSLYDETTIFTQQRVFRVITDHLIQKGPSFKFPLESMIDTSKGEVSVRYTDNKGREKSISKHIQLPPDLANGMLFTLVKDIPPGSANTVSFLALTPQPRIVKLAFRAQGKDAFTTDGLRQSARRYIMKVQLGGLEGMIAPLIGKEPPDTQIWIMDGEVPTFAAWQGPFYDDGPAWRINMVSPVQVPDTARKR